MHKKNRLIVAWHIALIEALTLPLLVDQGYRITDLEVLIIAASGVLAAIPLALVSIRWAEVQRISFALLSSCLLELYFAPHQIISPHLLALLLWEDSLNQFNAFDLSLISSGFILIFIWSACFTRFETNIYLAGTVFALFFILSSIFISFQPLLSPSLQASTSATAKNDDRLPLVVHFIIDEQGAPVGFPADSAAGRLIAPYLQRGFAAQAWLRANSGATEQSLSKIFSVPGNDDTASNLVKSGNDFNFSLVRNYYLEQLAEHGFIVTVIQNSHLRLCADQAVNCHTYAATNYGHAMRRFEYALAERVELALSIIDRKWIGMDLYRPLRRWLIRQKFMPSLSSGYRTSPANVLEVLDEIEQRAGAMKGGEAYVVHLLLPHHPYMLNQHCQLLPRNEWRTPEWAYSAGMDGSAQMKHNDPIYWGQVQCLHNRLLPIIDAIERNVGRDGAIILLHGDHGSRLNNYDAYPTKSQLESEQPERALDTLMLLRTPGLGASVNNNIGSLDKAAWEAFSHFIPIYRAAPK